MCLCVYDFVCVCTHVWVGVHGHVCGGSLVLRLKNLAVDLASQVQVPLEDLAQVKQ